MDGKDLLYRREGIWNTKLMRSCAALMSLLALLLAGPLGAQQSATLRGVVVDSVTRRAVSDVAITVAETSAQSVTDRFGGFHLADLPLGSYLLTFTKPGFRSRSFRFTITEEFLREVDLGAMALLAAPEGRVMIRGFVRDAATGIEMPNLPVTVNGSVVTVTDERGAFEIDGTLLRAGVNHLELRQLGYQPFTYQIRMSQNQPDLRLSLEMEPVAVQLEEVVVEGEADAEGKFAAFYDRKRRTNGRFLTPQQVEAMQPLRFTTDILRRVPGVLVGPGTTNATVRFARADVRCERQSPLVYIDGLPRGEGVRFNELLSSQDIAAVEAYAPGRIPLEFNALNANCGMIMIWTKSARVN